MSYDVQFVGLICFITDDDGRHRALVPDGRFADPGIQPHLASISVRTEDLKSIDGWRDDEVTSDPYETEFFFPPSRIVLSFPDAGKYIESDGWGDIPRMSKLDKNYKIESDANWIANIPIDNGDLKTFRIPGLPNPSRTPLLCQLTVQHDDEIRIAVTARKGWPTRRILLNPRSEIAIINTSRGLAPKSLSADHFQIYGELSSQQVTLRAPQKDYSHRPVSESRHPTFRQPRPATFTPDCIVGTI